jgi:acyl carrier protein
MSVSADSIAQVISTRFKIERSKILPEVSFDDLGLDSLSQIELAFSLQKELGIDIDDEELAQISTVSELVTLANKIQ